MRRYYLVVRKPFLKIIFNLSDGIILLFGSCILLQKTLKLKLVATQWMDLVLPSPASSPSTSKVLLIVTAPPLTGIGPGKTRVHPVVDRFKI